MDMKGNLYVTSQIGVQGNQVTALLDLSIVPLCQLPVLPATETGILTTPNRFVRLEMSGGSWQVQQAGFRENDSRSPACR
jgi:hypothetical protein